VQVTLLNKRCNVEPGVNNARPAVATVPRALCLGSVFYPTIISMAIMSKGLKDILSFFLHLY
jgi:hypothetical protein